MLSLEKVFHQGSEIIVLYSGGKDSTYTLLKLCESGRFHIHALTFDNGYIKKEARENIAMFSEKENFEHHYVSPDMAQFKAALRTCKEKLKTSEHYRSYFERNGVFCWPCFSFLYNTVYQYACQHGIAYIFGGWNPGQIAEGRHKTQEKGQIPYLEVYHAFVLPFIEFLQSNEAVTNGFCKTIDPSMQIVPYFLFEEYNKEKIRAYIKKEGWREPAQCESCTSNCELNLADRFLYRDFFGKDRYERQIQKMIEKGIDKPEEKLRVHNEILDQQRANTILEEIALS